MPKAQPHFVADARQYVSTYLLQYLPPTYLFHNYEYGEEIVSVCKMLAEKADLSATKKEQLELAAWFYLTGFVGGYEGTAQRSAEIARSYLTENGYGEEGVAAVSKLILSTQADYMPVQTQEKIFFDARWSYLGRKRFFTRAELFRLEIEQVEGKQRSPHKWNKRLLHLLKNTPFYTPWAKETYSTRRHLNIAQQQQIVVKAKEQSIRQKTGKNFGRGVDTVYRVTLRNHINLSSIADGKANMIININTLILSVLITGGSAAGFSIDQSLVGQKIYFAIPIATLMLSTLLAILFAVLSVIPKISGSPRIGEAVEIPKSNLLYFGNFLKLEKESFVSRMKELKNDQSVLYDELSRDLYNLGMVLQKKYQLLTYAYRTFIIGLILSVLIFIFTYVFVLL